MKSIENCWRLILVAGLGCLPCQAIAKVNTKSLEQFRFDQAPQKADWQYFLKAPEAERERLWNYQVKAHHPLAKWAWGWRLGWVRACGESQAAFCGEVLHQALFDKAMVVRAEAATRYGRRFEATKGDAAVRAVSDLADAYRLTKNTRGGKPMFVAARILFALHVIGKGESDAGGQALKAGERLAAAHPETAAYWKKLVAAD